MFRIDYVEAIFIAVVDASRIDEVRITATDRAILWDLCFDAHGRKLSDAERALAPDFLQVLRATRDRDIRLSEVPDA